MEISHEAVTRHLRQAEELGVELSAASEDSAPAIGDDGRLLQVISNLIENALRLTPPGGRIVVETAPGQIRVRDTGPGLAPEDLAHAFERFYLHDRYRAERPVGSGLGLAIVEELVGAMGGTVEASNCDGGGAAFTIHLPTPEPRAKPPRSAPPDAVLPSA